jgi:putative hydrolase of the HAD superfamily
LKTYQHIFWDLDHTLWDFDTNSLTALKQTYDAHNLATLGITDFNTFSTRYHVHNEKYWERFRKGFINRETLRWKRFYVTLLDYKIADEALANALGSTYLDILPIQTNLMRNAIEILEYCKAKNIRQHIITNGFEGTQNVKMQNSNILHYFDKIITSERAMSLKPHAAIYNYALQQTGALVNGSLMIGDAIAVDVKGAIDFGMDAVWFNPHESKNTTTITPTHTVFQLQELLNIL